MFYFLHHPRTKNIIIKLLTKLCLFRYFAGEGKNGKLNFSECHSLPLLMESKPILIYAEICTFCNMNCRMCGKATKISSDLGMMKKEIFERLIGAGAQGGTLAMFGRGETLMHPDFTYFLKLAKDKGMKVMFNSNGKALTTEIASAMVKYGQDSITISCSAGRPETYEMIHQGGEWIQLWENIENLVKIKQQAFSATPNIYIEFVCQADNVSELPCLVRRALDYKLSGVLVVDVVAHTEQMEKQRMNLPEKLPIANKYYAQALDILKEPQYNNTFFDLRLPASYNALTKKSCSVEIEKQLNEVEQGIERNAVFFNGANMCLEPWQTFYVRFDGAVAPCCVTNRNLGELSTQYPLEIWNGLAFQKFRSRMRSEKKPFECLRCHFFPGPQRYDKSLNDSQEYEAL